MTTQIYELMEGESPAAWKYRVAHAFDGMVEALNDGCGDPNRMILTVERDGNGYSVTITAVRHNTLDKDTAEA